MALVMSGCGDDAGMSAGDADGEDYGDSLATTSAGPDHGGSESDGESGSNAGGSGTAGGGGGTGGIDDSGGTGGDDDTTGNDATTGDDATTGADETTSDGVTSDGTTGAGDSDTGDECTPTVGYYSIESTPPSIALLLDKSGSMSTEWDHDEDENTPEQTRWSSLHGVTSNIVETFAPALHFGVQLFPGADAPSYPLVDACELGDGSPEVAVGPNDPQVILDAIPAASGDPIQGSTPAVAAVENAVAHLETIDPASAPALVLVTDGAANCKAGEEGWELNKVYDDTLPAVVGATFEGDGVPVYVVGIDIVDELIDVPETNPFESLNDVAIAGGVARDGDEKFYNTTSEIELQAALDAISWSIECTVQLDQEIPYPGVMSVMVDGELAPQVKHCQGEDGWAFVAEGNPEFGIKLCGGLCAAKDESTEIEVTAGCYE